MTIAYGVWEREEREGALFSKISKSYSQERKGELHVQETPHIAQVSRPHPPE
jgi:hypothetical protein